MGIKEMDIDAVAKVIEVDAGESLPDLRQALKEAKAVMAGRITTPEQILVCGKHAKDPA
jgi:putative transcriptional regulator